MFSRFGRKKDASRNHEEGPPTGRRKTIPAKSSVMLLLEAPIGIDSELLLNTLRTAGGLGAAGRAC